MKARPRIYPQFASHKRTDRRRGDGDRGKDRHFEFQRLHGMGDQLYREVTETGGQPCRIYAPVGGHKDLLAYLVRRLLENGANSSFVAAVGDSSVEISTLLTRPADVLEGGDRARHARIPLPADLFGSRRNSKGVELADEAALEPMLKAIDAAGSPISAPPPRSSTASRLPALTASRCRRSTAAPPSAASSTQMPRREKGCRLRRSRLPRLVGHAAETRAAILERAADLLEDRLPAFLAMLGLEAGKTLGDGIAEVREAVEFCRYYAAEARRLFAARRRCPARPARKIS